MKRIKNRMYIDAHMSPILSGLFRPCKSKASMFSASSHFRTIWLESVSPFQIPLNENRSK